MCCVRRRSAAGLPGLLKGAPEASWLLARLKHLSLSLSFPDDCLQTEDDLGGYMLELLAVKGVEPVARLTIEAECGEILLATEAASDPLAREVVGGLVDALVDDPPAVSRCELRVRAAELGGVNEYGWDGTKYLGVHNRRCD